MGKERIGGFCVAEVRILDERIEILGRQWKWIIGLLAGLIAAVTQALLRR